MPDQLDTIQKLSVPRYAPRIEPLAIPEPRWNDEPLVCLEVNDEWASHIIGVMIALDQSDAWLGTEEEIYDARQQVNEIMLAFMEVCMSCCIPEIPLSRINEDGVFQQSTDGGATWVDAPQYDPRNNIPRIPAFPTSDTEGAKCIYADSVVNHFKEGFIDVIEEGQTVTEVMGVITAIMEWVFGPLTGPIGWIIPALFAIATAVIAFGITLLKGEFTTDLWNQLRCLLFCNMGEDGSFTADQTSTIYAGIDDITSDIPARTVLKSWIAAIGATGLTNAAHLGMGTTGADCSGCPCEACDSALWGVGLWNEGAHGGTFGTITGRTANTISVTSVDRGDGVGWVVLSNDVSNAVWCKIGWEITGTTTNRLFNVAPAVADFSTLVVNNLATSPADNISQIVFYGTLGFSVVFTFVA